MCDSHTPALPLGYARFHVTGGVFHVISRFHDRRFYMDIDGAREKYLELLGKAAETHGMALIRYVHNNPVRAGIVARRGNNGGKQDAEGVHFKEEPWG